MADTIYKGTLIFRFQPDETLYNIGVPGKDGGWSESLWCDQAFTPAMFNNWATARAQLMGQDCQIIGWRTTPYVYTGNKLIPAHSSVGVIARGGVIDTETNSPDDCLRLIATASAIPISFTMFLHAIPDNLIQSGQYIEEQTYDVALTNYINLLKQGLVAGKKAWWLGRDPSQIAQRVVRVNNPLGSVTTQISIGAINGQDFIRLRRVYDDFGKPITGTYLCTNQVVNADLSVTYTLQGLPTNPRNTPSGTARVDKIKASPITAIDVRSLSSRKVGRPTLLYRGRRTKTR